MITLIEGIFICALTEEYMSATRREVMIGGGMAMLAAAMPLAQAGAAGTWTRYSATSPDGKKMLAKYAKAVDIMKNKIPSTDPRNWNFQWFTHWVPGPSPQQFWDLSASVKKALLDQTFGPAASPARALAEEMWNACQSHGVNPANPQAFQITYFLPWHRWFVYYFEQIIRTVLNDATFALPYWDYLGKDAKSACIPDEFIDPNSPLYVPIRNSWVNKGERIDKENPGTLNFGAADFPYYVDEAGKTGFCPTINQNPHGLVHDYTGNDVNMGFVPTAAQDPIFWLHHCNIDRLWASWNKAGYTNPTWDNRRFPFANGEGKRVEVDLNGAGSTSQLSYDYDTYQPLPDKPKEVASVRAKALTATKAAPSLSATALPKLQDKAPSTVTLQPVAANEARLLSAAPAGGASVFLVLSDVEIDTAMGGTYNLFLDLPEGAPATVDSPSFVGTFGSFAITSQGGHAGHHGGTGGGGLTLDASAAVAKLSAAGKLTATPTVTFVPMGAVTRPPTVGSVALVTD